MQTLLCNTSSSLLRCCKIQIRLGTEQYTHREVRSKKFARKNQCFLRVAFFGDLETANFPEKLPWLFFPLNERFPNCVFRGVFITTSTFTPRCGTVGIRCVDGVQLARMERWSYVVRTMNRSLQGLALGAVAVAAGYLYTNPVQLDKMKTWNDINREYRKAEKILTTWYRRVKREAWDLLKPREWKSLVKYANKVKKNHIRWLRSLHWRSCLSSLRRGSRARNWISTLQKMPQTQQKRLIIYSDEDIWSRWLRALSLDFSDQFDFHSDVEGQRICSNRLKPTKNSSVKHKCKSWREIAACPYLFSHERPCRQTPP